MDRHPEQAQLGLNARRQLSTVFGEIDSDTFRHITRKAKSGFNIIYTYTCNIIQYIQIIGTCHFFDLDDFEQEQLHYFAYRI